MSLKHKMTALISTMLMLMILLSMIFIYSQSSTILTDEAEKYMEAQLDRANENVRLLLSRIVLETEKLSMDQRVKEYFTNPDAQESTDVYLTDLMAKKNVEDLLYMDLFLVNLDGQIVSAAMKDAIGVDVSNRSYFKKAVNFQTTDTSDIILSRADKTQIVITLTPTLNDQGQTIGYTGIAIFATYFSSFLEDFNVSNSNGYIIIDSFDNIVSHPDKSLISSNFDYFGNPSTDFDEFKTLSIDNETYRILEKNLGFNNWKIISFLKYGDIYSKSLELSYSFMKISVVIFLVALIFSFYLTDMISKPIVTITESINRILDDEENFQSAMLNQMSLKGLDPLVIAKTDSTEPTEVSNLRKAMLGFKSALEKGSKNFDIEYTKLQLYIDGLDKELENINGRNLEFIATLSHDIRTPLTLIKGYARGLESGEVTDPLMQKKFQSGIVKSVGDIENLVYNVLDFVYEINRMDSLNLKQYAMTEVVNEITFELEQLHQHHKRNISFELDDFTKEPGRVLLDLANLKRVIINLLNNSMKYTDIDARILLKINKTQKGVHFEVFDEGFGIKNEDLDTIFEMFYRTDDSKDIKGYGLGLYISQQILKRHGTTLKCKSVYGKYTRMFFELEWISPHYSNTH